MHKNENLKLWIYKKGEKNFIGNGGSVMWLQYLPESINIQYSRIAWD